ncbi:kelch-like protein 10 [Amphibalanus amphitrite]|uniref:kelch-like protein 10 n=1 Tax=Amphibalanus amphitrite TaxID=1232801 RepID=UPI001C907AA7|nr:kelch-like protein 10 [Amphibalanus amphitrite]
MEGPSPEEQMEVENVGRTISFQSMHALNELRQQKLLCDAIIRLEDGSAFSIHRALMSACSPYFRALFTTSLHENERTDILIRDVSFEAMRLVIEYAYTRNTLVDADNVEMLLRTADYFNIEGMLKDCCSFLMTEIGPRNCFGIKKFASFYGCVELEREIHNYIMRNFVDIAHAPDNEELLNLPADEMCEILGADNLNVKNEEVVWETMLNWIERDPQNRKQHIHKLMKQIRLGLLETSYFVEKVKNHPYVIENEDCRPLIIETLKFIYDLEMITQRDGEVTTPELARPRVPHEILFAIGGWSGGSPTNFIETYDTRADRWVKVKEVDPSGPRAYHGTAVIGFDIYVIGGFDGMDYFNSCRCFNAVTKQWREVGPMNARRCYVSVGILDGYIYAMGGYDGHHRQNTVERYNPRTNQWSMVVPMHMQRSDACATTLNGKIYIAGGFNGQECMNSSEMFDPETSQWTMLAPMRCRRSGVSCIGYHNQLYVLGGFNGISRMCSGEKYNPETETWTPIPDMYNPRSNFAIEVIDDMIFAIGGFNGVTTIYHVECYDDKNSEWYEATDMNIYRSALSACVIIGPPNVSDYIHKHRDKLMEEKRQKLLALQNNQRT